MKTFSKIAITILSIAIFLLLFGLLGLANQNMGKRTPGILGVLLLTGLIGAIRAVWKKPKDTNDDNTDIQKK